MISSTILVVDDSPDALALITSLLMDEGYQVRSASNGRLALASIQAQTPDLVLLDIRMPVMDGLEACRRLKADPSTSAIPVVFMSTTSEIQERVEGLRLGAVDFISKPLHPEECLLRIRTHLNMAKLATQLKTYADDLEQANRQLRVELSERSQMEKRYQMLADNTTDIIILMDRDLRAIYASPSVIRASGYSRLEFESLPFDRQLTPASFSALRQALDGALLPGEGNGRESDPLCSLDVEFRRKDGSTYWSETVFVLVADEQGHGSNILASGRDITARKQAETLLLRQAAILDAMISSPMNTMALLDTEGTILKINPGGAKNFNAAPEAMVGKNIFALIPEPLSSQRKQKIEHVVRTGQPIHFEDQRQDLFFVNHIYPVKDPSTQKIMWVTIFASDITASKLWEKALKESEERFRIIFERSTIGKSLTSPDGRLLQVNQAFAEMLGYSIDELQQLNFAQITPAGEMDESREFLRALLADEKKSCRFEKQYVHRDGSLIWADISTTLLRNQEGSPLYFVTSIANITDKKNDEARIKNLNRMYAVLSEINQAIVRNREIGLLFDQACRVIVEIGGFAGASIGLSGGNQDFHISTHFGVGGDLRWELAGADPDSNPLSSTLKLALQRKQHQIWQPNLPPENDQTAQPGAKGMSRVIMGIFPLVVFGEAHGTLNIYTSDPNVFDETEIKLMDELAADISFAMEVSASDALRAQTASALAASEERWHSLVMSIPDYVSLLNARDELIFLNHYAEGFQEGDFSGRSVYEFIAPESMDVFRKNIQQSRDTGRISKFEHSALGNNREWRAYEDFVVPFHDATSRQTVMVLSRDITERKQADAQITEQLEELNRWYSATLGREARMLELKREINQLLVKMGQQPRYLTTEENLADG